MNRIVKGFEAWDVERLAEEIREYLGDIRLDESYEIERLEYAIQPAYADHLSRTMTPKHTALLILRPATHD